MTRRVVFLDRDGTINVDHHYVHRWDQWEFTPGAVEGLRLLRAAGFRLAIVSNQAGIARGYFRTADVDALHARLREQLLALRVPIDAIAYCAHGPQDNCGCRKPQPGLARNVEQLLNESVDYGRSWTVGDKPSDVEFGKAIGTRTALLTSEYWSEAELTPAQQPDITRPTLLDAARHIVAAIE